MERAAILRHRIDYYRRRLSEGLEAELALQYLRQLAADEFELAELAGHLKRKA